MSPRLRSTRSCSARSRSCLAKSTPGDDKTVPAVLTGLLLFHILFASNLALSTGFLEETWTRSLLNLMVTPLRETEYLIGTAVFGLSKVFIGMVFVSCTALLFYAFNVTTIAVQLVPSAIILLFMGWVLALFVIGLVLRFGAGAEVLAWALAFLLWPLSGAFYAVGALPGDRSSRSHGAAHDARVCRVAGRRRRRAAAVGRDRDRRGRLVVLAALVALVGAVAARAVPPTGLRHPLFVIPPLVITAFTAADVVRHDGVALGPVEEVGEVLGQRGPDAGGLLDRVGELGRVGGRERDHGDVGDRAPPRSAARNPDRGVRVDDDARPSCRCAAICVECAAARRRSQRRTSPAARRS